MTNYLVTMKFDYYTIEAVIAARTSQAAMSKAKRLWPMREILSARVL